MDKALLPSVTLIVGCGVSSLTLLLLIIIYVSVWKYVAHARSPPSEYLLRSGLSLIHPLPFQTLRYIRSERSVILINFCLSIICSNALILVGQTQARNKVKRLFQSLKSLSNPSAVTGFGG